MSWGGGGEYADLWSKGREKAARGGDGDKKRGCWQGESLGLIKKETRKKDGLFDSWVDSIMLCKRECIVLL